MKTVFILFALHCLLIKANSQSLQGFVRDEMDKPVESVTVSLLKSADSSAIKFTVTGKDGSYEFINIKKGDYLVSVTHVGFTISYSSHFIYNSDIKVIPVLILEANKKEMNAVTVQSTRPFIEMHLDKMVLNVEASPTNAGSNVLEVLAKSPSVNVDMNDNISLNGKQGVLILLDGKRTYLSSSDLATLLKSMPSSSIDQIEIMRIPPAKYDADGMAGVINIKTKKSKNDGFNGNLTTGIRTAFYKQNGTGYILTNTQNNLNFNYRKNKINLYGAMGLNTYKGMGVSTYDKTYYTTDNSINGYNYFVINGNFSGTYSPISFGADYTLDKKNVISVASSTILIGTGNNPRERISEIKNADASVVSNYTAFLNNSSSFNKSTWNVNWKHNIDTLGQEFSLDADYVQYQFPYNEQLVTTYSDGASNTKTYMNTDARTATGITAFKADYTKPFKKGRIEAGMKTSFVRTSLDNEYFKLLNDKWETQAGLNNHFSYNENINALYVNLSRQIKKWSFQGGLRLETIETKGKQTLTGTGFDRKNTGLFPSIFTSYDIDKNNTVKLSFSRRINRPQFYALMPYLTVVDSLDVWRGNPDLKPEHSNTIELSYALKNEYFFTVSYNITNDVLRYIAAQIGTEKATEFYPLNIDKLKSLNMTISSPFKPAKWWDINVFTSVYANKYFNLQNGAGSQFYFTMNQNITNTIKLSKSLKGELTINYTTKSIDQLSENEARFDNLLVGVQKQILKEKGNITLNVSDPFEWFSYSYRSHFIRMYEVGTGTYPSRSINLSFNYRFGRVNNQSRQRTTASQEEQRR
jgi:iron complex outermembrane recepter protein